MPAALTSTCSGLGTASRSAATDASTSVRSQRTNAHGRSAGGSSDVGDDDVEAVALERAARSRAPMPPAPPVTSATPIRSPAAARCRRSRARTRPARAASRRPRCRRRGRRTSRAPTPTTAQRSIASRRLSGRLPTALGLGACRPRTARRRSRCPRGPPPPSPPARGTGCRRRPGCGTRRCATGRDRRRGTGVVRPSAPKSSEADDEVGRVEALVRVDVRAGEHHELRRAAHDAADECAADGRQARAVGVEQVARRPSSASDRCTWPDEPMPAWREPRHEGGGHAVLRGDLAREQLDQRGPVGGLQRGGRLDRDLVLAVPHLGLDGLDRDAARDERTATAAPSSASSRSTR